ncbi:MAG: MMPL family transporter [Planctomycetota bacterium]
MRDRLLEALAGLALRRPWWVLAAALLLTAVAGGLAATQLGLDSNQDHLVAEDLPYQERFLEFLETFGDRELLYVVVDAEGDLPAARATLAQVASDLRAHPELFDQVSTGLDPQALAGRALLLAPEAEVERLAAHADELGELAQGQGFVGLLELWTRFLGRPQAAEDDPEQAQLAFDFLRGLLGALEDPAAHDPQALVEPLLPGFEVRREDTELRVGELLLLTAVPRRDYAELNPVEGPLNEARAALERALAAHPGVEGGVTGRPAISADEVRRTSEDTALSALLALAGVALVFGLFFKSVVRPALAIASLLVGIAATAGFATLAIGTLNFLSSVFLIILIGLGIDYAVHFLARYQALRAGGEPLEAALRLAVLESGRGNVTAALSSALAFYSMLLTDFRGLSELGLIAGTGILLCCLTTLLVLPALLVLCDRSSRAPRPLPTFARLERLHSRPQLVLVLVGLTCLLGAPALRWFRFEENLLALQADEEESVRWERRLMDAEASTWITASRVPTLEQALERQAAFAALDSSVVARVEGPGDYLGPRVEARREELAAIGSRLGPPPPVPGSLDPAALQDALLNLSDALSAAAEGALRLGGAAADYVEPLLELADRADALSSSELDAGALTPFQREFFSELRRRFARLGELTHPEPWTAETLPPAIREHFVGDDGSFAVYVYPTEDVWHPPAMERFLQATREVDPELTGSTVSVHEASFVLREAFEVSTLVTLTLVLLILGLDFRGRGALLALVPLVLGGLWLAEAMGALGLSLNMANFFCVPILLGLGIDDGVHIVHRAQEAPGAPLAGHAAGTGVVLSSLTTMIGFGSLMTSSHAGLASLGAVMALGAGVLLLAAVGVVPALIRLRTPARQA